jgi:carbon-monoxide dehydrogenase large subunit
MLEVAEDDLEWDIDRFQVKGLPDKVATRRKPGPPLGTQSGSC